MNPTLAIDLGRELLILALLVSLPMLATAIVVGLVIAIFQAVTAVHEQTLSTVPKMIAVLAIALLVMPWAMGKVVFFTHNLLRDLPRYASQR
jgi:flagellar biosynthetic protein FliQ